MDNMNSDTESSDGEDWKDQLYEERIDSHWLTYNPHAFFPLDDYFYRTGAVSKVNIDIKIPSSEWTPHFVIGCGRSGTTVIAKILSGHPELCFLNEPRGLWMQIFPNFDVWSSQAEKRKGRLKMKKPSDESQAKKINELLFSVTEMLGKTTLVEKTPENTFRLDWLDALFPNCKFIMVKRNPIQTARSISRFQPDTWFGYNKYKWSQLLVLLEHFKHVFKLPEDYISHAEDCVFAKALVEWALCTLSAEEFKLKMNSEERKRRFYELHLESMIRNPTEETNKLMKFLNLKDNEKVYQLANSLLHRDLTFSSCIDHLSEYLINGVSEETLLGMAGSDLRNLIFQHSYHL
ncbi:hypothetical protein SteCoe_22913 [Stentor coeruleus]|uniref:protein-tyrosine sulfotransferase n=1 Tax=Stentor coeruleus TaxID=5963 RepID=A0A1R2BL01_9CILI|nr:hypothetical protein SteCoe_22913 [Stentor coeruleus]